MRYLMRSAEANTPTVEISAKRVACRISQLTKQALLGPEIAVSERFKTKVLYDQAFQDHHVLVAIDEVHVVSEWGQNWREQYSKLGSLRDLISTSVPWLGCSATLDAVTLTEVRDLCGFHPSVRIQRTSIDRADIKFEIRQIQQSMNGFGDLEFLVEEVHAAVEQFVGQRIEDLARKALQDGCSVAAQAVLESTRDQRKEAGPYSRACCHRSPKTIVYIDSIAKILKAVGVLCNGLHPARSTDSVCAYSHWHRLYPGAGTGCAGTDHCTGTHQE